MRGSSSSSFWLLETKPAKLMSIWLAHQGTGVHVLSLRAVRKWQRRGKASVFSRKDVDDLQCLGLSALAVSAEVPPLSLLFDSPVLAVPALIPAPMLFVLGGTPFPLEPIHRSFLRGHCSLCPLHLSLRQLWLFPFSIPASAKRTSSSVRNDVRKAGNKLQQKRRANLLQRLSTEALATGLQTQASAAPSGFCPGRFWSLFRLCRTLLEADVR